MMFDFINAWKNIWINNDSDPVDKMPLTEHKEEDVVPYPFPVKKVRVKESIEIAYIDEGDSTAGVLLFVHGMGGGIPGWRKNFPDLKKHFRCIALDLPGHGHSSKED